MWLRLGTFMCLVLFWATPWPIWNPKVMLEAFCPDWNRPHQIFAFCAGWQHLKDVPKLNNAICQAQTWCSLQCCMPQGARFAFILEFEN
jgi:hypothetical protein